MGQSAMMTGAQTCVKMLNPSVNQTTLPYGTTRMGINPAEERKRRTRRRAGKAEVRKDQGKRQSWWRERSKAVSKLFAS